MTNDERNDTLVSIQTTVEDMHHRLFGNGQPGIIDRFDARIKDLEAQKSRVLGAVTLIKYSAGLTPMIVGIAEGIRIWLQRH